MWNRSVAKAFISTALAGWEAAKKLNLSCTQGDFKKHDFSKFELTRWLLVMLIISSPLTASKITRAEMTTSEAANPRDIKEVK